jgi:multiple sugar transport system substrate-binding protein
MCEGVTGTVDFRWWGGDARAALQMEAIAAFEARYPGITIVPQPMDLAGYRDRLTVEAAGGNLVDVATYNVEWLSAFGGDNGVLMNLSESPFIDLAPIEHALGEVSFDGSVFALPTGMTAPAIFANKAIFDEAGVAMPNDDTWSWDEMIAIAQEISDAGLTNENGESVFGMSNLGGQIVARVWANQTDGGMFAEDGTVNWTTDSIERYFTMVNDMIESGALPSAALQSETSPLSLPEQLMPLGRAALQPQWSNQVGAIVSASGENAEIEVLRFPGDSTEAHNGTWLRPTMTFAISETAQSPEAAACFVNWMVNDVEAGQIMGIDRGIPLNPEVYDAVISNLTNPNDLKQAAFVERIAARPGIAIPVPEISDDLQATLLTPSESAMFMRQSIADAAATLRTNLEGILVR